MTRDEIIRMASEADREWDCDRDTVVWLEWFAALVAAKKEQQMLRDGWRQCAKGQRTTQHCGLLDAAVKAEREACARIVESVDNYANPMTANDCAAAIRARGNV